MKRGYLNINDEDEMLARWTNLPILDSRQDFGLGTSNQGVCLKCQFRGAAEMFTSEQFPDFAFAKDIAEKLTQGKTPRVIPERFLRFLLFQNEFSEDHLPHVAHIRTPGIVVMGAIHVDNEHKLFSYLVDGTHRAVNAVRQARDFSAYLLTAKDTALCAMATRKRVQSGDTLLLDPTPDSRKKEI